MDAVTVVALVRRKEGRKEGRFGGGCLMDIV